MSRTGNPLESPLRGSLRAYREETLPREVISAFGRFCRSPAADWHPRFSRKCLVSSGTFFLSPRWDCDHYALDAVERQEAVCPGETPGDRIALLRRRYPP